MTLSHIEGNSNISGNIACINYDMFMNDAMHTAGRQMATLDATKTVTVNK